MDYFSSWQLTWIRWCPTWTHSRAADLLDPPVSNLDTFPAGRSPGSAGVQLGHIPSWQISWIRRCPTWTHSQLADLLDPPVSNLDTFPAGRSPVHSIIIRIQIGLSDRQEPIPVKYWKKGANEQNSSCL